MFSHVFKGYRDVILGYNWLILDVHNYDALSNVTCPKSTLKKINQWLEHIQSEKKVTEQ